MGNYARASAIAAAILLTACGGADPPARDYNILLVTFDTTRADHLGPYGKREAHTPHLDRLAREGVVFEHAYSAAPITAPSHSTILTGLYPMAHGVRDNGAFVLAPEQITLAERLQEVGYATGAAVASFPLAAQFGLNQGFDLYDDHFTLTYEDFRGERLAAKSRMFFDERPAELVNEPISRWISQQRGPFFAWAHYFDPHLPLEPPPPYDEIFLHDLYLGEIAYADEALGQLLELLDRSGLAESTIVMVTSDHGEGRGEHNELTHSTLAYDTTLHVPLVVRAPGVEGGRRVAGRVSTVDIVPTLLELLGLEVPQDLQGSSLAGSLLESEPPSAPRSIYAETLSPRISHGLGEIRALFRGEFKYIFGPRPELYRIDTDPAELEDLVDLEAETAKSMERRLAHFVSEHAVAGASRSVTVDPATRARLEALGYLSSAQGTYVIDERLIRSGEAPQDRVSDVNEVSSAKNELLQGRPENALVLARTLLRRSPSNIYYLQLRATAEFHSGLLEESLSTLREIIAIRPDGLPDQDLVLRMVDALHYSGRSAEALEVLRNQQATQPSAIGQWYLASLHEIAADELSRSAALERALEIDPSFAPARVDRAIDAARAGELEAALEEIERALADRPYYPKGHFNVAVVLLELGSSERALHHLRRAALLQPSYIKAHHAIVRVSWELGELDVAERHARELMSIAPGHALTLEALALVDAEELES